MKILLTKEVAKILRLSEWRVRELCRDGTIKCYKEGNRSGFRIEESEIERYVKRKMKEGI